MGIATWSDQVCMVILISSVACSIPGLERPQAGPFRVSAAADPDDLIRPIDHLDAAPASPSDDYKPRFGPYLALKSATGSLQSGSVDGKLVLCRS